MITKSLYELNIECLKIMSEFVCVGTSPRDNGKHVGVICVVDGECLDCKVTANEYDTPQQALSVMLQLIGKHLSSYPSEITRDGIPIRCPN